MTTTSKVTGTSDVLESGRTELLVVGGRGASPAVTINGDVEVQGFGARAEFLGVDPAGAHDVDLNADVSVDTAAEGYGGGGYGGYGAFPVLLVDAGLGGINQAPGTTAMHAGIAGGTVILRGAGPMTLDGTVIAADDPVSGATGAIQVFLEGSDNSATGGGLLRANHVAFIGTGENDVNLNTDAGELFFIELDDVSVNNLATDPATFGFGSTFGAVALNFAGPATWRPPPGTGEPGEAGDILATAQAVTGNVTVRTLSGSLSAGTDADIFEIFVEGGGTFSASIDGDFDAELWLFDAGGFGVYAADQTRLPAFDPLTPTAAGNYFLAVSGSQNDPLDTMGDFMFGCCDVVGPVTAFPFDAFEGLGFSSGTYEIQLTGTQGIGGGSSGGVFDNLVIVAGGTLDVTGVDVDVQGVTNWASLGGAVNMTGATVTTDELVVIAAGDVTMAGANLAAPGGLFMEGQNILNGPTTIALGGGTVSGLGITGDLVLADLLQNEPALQGIPVGSTVPNATFIGREVLDLSETTVDLGGQSASYLWLEGDLIRPFGSVVNAPQPLIVQYTPFTKAGGFTLLRAAGTPFPESPATTIVTGNGTDVFGNPTPLLGRIFANPFSYNVNWIFIGGDFAGPGGSVDPASIITSTEVVFFFDTVPSSDIFFEPITLDNDINPGDDTGGIPGVIDVGMCS